MNRIPFHWEILNTSQLKRFRDIWEGAADSRKNMEIHALRIKLRERMKMLKVVEEQERPLSTEAIDIDPLTDDIDMI